MPGSRQLANEWFSKWEAGAYHDLPITDDFIHVSPYGTITGKREYLKLVADNVDKFLGHRFEILDEVYSEGLACVRYRAVQGDFSLEVSEWQYSNSLGIHKIVAYYNIQGEIDDSRKLKMD